MCLGSRPSAVTICVALVWFASPSHGALNPQQVVIIANTASSESLAVARHYAEQRQIPRDHLIMLPLPLRDSLSRREYEQLVIAPLRQTLRERGLASSICALVTTYGIPLRVEAPLLSDEERRLLADAQHRIKTSRAKLEQIRTALAKLIPQGMQGPSPAPGGSVVLESAKAALFLLDVDRVWRAALEQMRRPDASRADQQVISEFLTLSHQYGGWALLLQHRSRAEQPPAAPEPSHLSAWRTLLDRTAPLWTGLPHQPLLSDRSLLYQWAERLFGAKGVLELASAEVDLLTTAHADASFDSELSLLWWDPGLYAVAWRWDNPLFEEASPQPQNPPILMVSRLDAPTAELAKGLVDRALQAERSRLDGTIYFDARGLQPEGPVDTYGIYDHSLREAAKLAKEETSHEVVLDLAERTMASMPNVALYIGWYRLRSYDDVFSFNPGAIGYHMASAEAVTIHDPKERGWCKNALERGITATLGSVGEPYLDSFPEPARFTRLLVSGKYSLVEVYYLATRHISWRMVLFGDPLYNPFRHRAVSPSASQTRRSPSEQPLGDPPATLEQRRLELEQRMKILLIILKEAEARLSQSPLP
ncbi:MAG: TIGR03790 family protein [Nitrospira sp.]|nr:TIGR03790 family protein [Nitrospira sp.]MCP9442293.1 TIGR03790 family protein [Nitrospira sp.]